MDRGGHFEHAVLQPVGHVDRVSERKLFHPRRLLVELQPARDPRRPRISFGFHEPPVGIGGQEAVDWDGAANVPQRHVEGIPRAVGVEGLLIEPIGPRPQKRNSAHAGFRFEFLDGRVRPPQDVRAVDLHFESHVAHRQRDGDGRAALGVFELNHVAVAASRIGLGRRPAQPRYRQQNRGGERQQLHDANALYTYF